MKIRSVCKFTRACITTPFFLSFECLRLYILKRNSYLVMRSLKPDLILILLRGCNILIILNLSLKKQIIAHTISM